MTRWSIVGSNDRGRRHFVTGDELGGTAPGLNSSINTAVLPRRCDSDRKPNAVECDRAGTRRDDTSSTPQSASSLMKRIAAWIVSFGNLRTAPFGFPVVPGRVDDDRRVVVAGDIGALAARAVSSSASNAWSSATRETPCSESNHEDVRDGAAPRARGAPSSTTGRSSGSMTMPRRARVVRQIHELLRGRRATRCSPRPHLDVQRRRRAPTSSGRFCIMRRMLCLRPMPATLESGGEAVDPLVEARPTSPSGHARSSAGLLAAIAARERGRRGRILRAARQEP